MKNDFSRTLTLRRIALTMLTIVVAFGILLATPQGRAWAQSILQFFTRTQGDTIPAPATPPIQWISPSGTSRPTAVPLPSPTGFAFSADCGHLPIQKCSIEQIRSMVDFNIKELGTIPDGLYFMGATGGPDMVIIGYDSADHSGGLSLIQQPWTGNPEQSAWQVGASAIVETVQIGNVTGEYVKGSYTYRPGDANEVWDPNLDAQSLHWVQDGVFFQMRASGKYVDKASFIALAESLTTRPVSAALPAMPILTPTPDTDEIYVPQTVTVVEAEKQAGFDVLEPSLLPEFLLSSGAIYKQQNQVVHLMYKREIYQKIPGAMNGLTLSQQVAPNPDECKLCGMRVGDNTVLEQDQFHMIVAPTATIELVQIGTVTGQFVEGHWIGSDCCGWIWTVEDIKTLRWWKNGMAFELIEVGFPGELTKADMVTIAESIK